MECDRKCICKICAYGTCCERDCVKPVFFAVSSQCTVPGNVKFGIRNCNEFAARSNLNFDGLLHKSFYRTFIKRYNFAMMVKRGAIDTEPLNTRIRRETKEITDEERLESLRKEEIKLRDKMADEYKVRSNMTSRKNKK